MVEQELLSTLQVIVYVMQIVGVVGTLTAAFIAVRTYMNTNKRAEEAKRKEQETRDRELETRRIGILQSLMSTTNDKDGNKRWIEQLRYEWKDYADFEKKYGTENNIEEASKRFATWNHWNSVGSMLRKGIVSIEDIYDTGGSGGIYLWEKFKMIVEENRRRYTGKFYLKDWEYLAGEMSKYMKTMDPSYTIPQTLDKYVLDK